MRLQSSLRLWGMLVACGFCFADTQISQSTAQASSAPAVYLLSRGIPDETVSYFRDLLTSNSITFSEITPVQAATTNLDGAIIIAGFSSEPVEYNNVAAKIAQSVRAGSWLLAAGHAVLLPAYAGIGTASEGPWDPLAGDRVYFIKSIDNSPLFSGLAAWDPPNAPDRPEQVLFYHLGPPKHFLSPAYTPPIDGSESSAIWDLWTRVGGDYTVPTTSAYCQMWAGCTGARSATQNSDYRTIRVGSGRIMTARVMWVSASEQMGYGPASAQIFKNFIQWAMRTIQTPSTPSVTKILPQFAFGGSWYSAVYFTNTGDTSVSFPLTFLGTDGKPLAIQSVGGSNATVNLPSRGTTMVEAVNSGPLTQGYVSVSLPTSVVGYGIFRQIVPGRDDQEAVVPFSGTSSAGSTLIWDDTAFVTAVAIVNLGSTNNTVTIVVRDDQGTTVGTGTVSIQAKSKVAFALRDVAGLAGVAGKRGSAEFSSSIGNLAVLGLRFSGSAFTSFLSPRNNRSSVGTAPLRAVQCDGVRFEGRHRVFMIGPAAPRFL